MEEELRTKQEQDEEQEQGENTFEKCIRIRVQRDLRGEEISPFIV
jgi:hypothetical protein